MLLQAARFMSTLEGQSSPEVLFEEHGLQLAVGLRSALFAVKYLCRFQVGVEDLRRVIMQRLGGTWLESGTFKLIQDFDGLKPFAPLFWCRTLHT